MVGPPEGQARLERRTVYSWNNTCAK
jgi:hypothetical protein